MTDPDDYNGYPGGYTHALDQRLFAADASDLPVTTNASHPASTLSVSAKRQALEQLAGTAGLRLVTRPASDHPADQGAMRVRYHNPFEIADRGLLASVTEFADTADEAIERMWRAMVDNLPSHAHIHVYVPGHGYRRVRWAGTAWHDLTEQELRAYRTGQTP